MTLTVPMRLARELQTIMFLPLFHVQHGGHFREDYATVTGWKKNILFNLNDDITTSTFSRQMYIYFGNIVNTMQSE